MKNFSFRHGLAALALVVSISLPLVHAGTAAAAGEGLSTPANKVGLISQAVAIKDLSVTGAGASQLNMNLYVPSGTLAFGNTAGLTFSGSSSGNNLNFSGTGTALNAALATLTYTSSGSGTFAVEASLGNSSGDSYNLANRHVYRVVTASGSGISWTNANTAAQAMTYGGVNGYLATITSQDEYNFIKSRISTSGWIGASDAQTEGQWKWVTGPETGTLFWTGTWDSSVSGSQVGGTGQLVSGQFANWAQNEPNDSQSNEDCAEMRFNNSVNGQWNDLDCASLDSAYVVEFGAPGNLPQVPYAKFNVNVTALPNNGDGNNDTIQDAQQANVKTMPNALTNNYATLAATNACTVTSSTMAQEADNAVQDAHYDYPSGLMNFTLNCGNNGTTTTVKQYYYGVNNADFVLRKYNPVKKTYTTVTNATISSQVIGGQQVMVATYDVTDGGPLDADGTVNGVIVDPAGLAQSNGTVDAPATGLLTENSTLYVAAVAAGAILVGAGFVLNRRLSVR